MVLAGPLSPVLAALFGLTSGLLVRLTPRATVGFFCGAALVRELARVIVGTPCRSPVGALVLFSVGGASGLLFTAVRGSFHEWDHDARTEATVTLFAGLLITLSVLSPTGGLVVDYSPSPLWLLALGGYVYLRKRHWPVRQRSVPLMFVSVTATCGALVIGGQSAPCDASFKPTAIAVAISIATSASLVWFQRGAVISRNARLS